MIVTCPSCNFEQPLESEYCPSCGGNLKSLLKEEKKEKKTQHIRTRAILLSLGLVLILGYLLIFVLKESKEKQIVASEDQSKTKSIESIKLKPGKIIGSAKAKLGSRKSINKDSSSPTNEGSTKSLKASATAFENSQAIKQASYSKEPITTIKNNLKENLTSKNASKTSNVNDTKKKSIVKIELRDSLNCSGLRQIAQTALNQDESSSFLNCSQLILTDIENDRNYVLEENDQILVSFKLDIDENEIVYTLSTLLDEEEFISKKAVNIPNVSDGAVSFVVLIEPKNTPENFEDSVEKSELLPLIFLSQGAEDQPLMALHISYAP